jgi:hypothetical protein
MSHKTRGWIRMVFAVPSATVLVFGASQALASPADPARAPDCETWCPQNAAYCQANPSNWTCRWCACNIILESIE